MSIASDTSPFRQDLRRLVAGARLGEASKRLVAATAGDEYGGYRNDVLSLAGRLSALQHLERSGTEDYGTLTRTRNKISLDLLQLIDDFPAAEALAAERTAPTGVSENQLKRRVLYILLAGKLIVLFFAWFQHDTGGGLTDEGLLTVIGILIPLFGAYLTLAFRDATRNRNILRPEDIRVNTDFARRTYLVVCAYPLLLCLLLYLRAIGVIPSLAALTVALGLAESGWGAYVGRVIMGLFQKRE